MFFSLKLEGFFSQRRLLPSQFKPWLYFRPPLATELIGLQRSRSTAVCQTGIIRFYFSRSLRGSRGETNRMSPTESWILGYRCNCEKQKQSTGMLLIVALQRKHASLQLYLATNKKHGDYGIIRHVTVRRALINRNANLR